VGVPSPPPQILDFGHYTLRQDQNTQETASQHNCNPYHQQKLSHPTAIMAGEKRAASGSFSSSSQMVVKRPNQGTNSSKAVAVVNGSAANGALIQAVCISFRSLEQYAEHVKEFILMSVV